MVVFGKDAARASVLQRILEFQDLGYVPVQAASLDAAPYAQNVLNGVNTAIVAYFPEEREEVLSHLSALRYARVLLVEERDGFQSLWVATRDLGGTMALEIQKNLLDRRNRIIKRAMDVTLGGFSFSSAFRSSFFSRHSFSW